ncbi:hypothetical protein PHLCEN_2v11854 [Hermanssonia centrifuga]|uniref:Uncharacterized protein n=1 Tax=Hermanssonia centrifuga TaxID=98765 RepID=A0A2R6NJT2_9APHY|nr:hypothetical protein PHLCEN_2v11854 [Hermanssonia centrifuga]
MAGFSRHFGRPLEVCGKPQGSLDEARQWRGRYMPSGPPHDSELLRSTLDLLLINLAPVHAPSK